MPTGRLPPPGGRPLPFPALGPRGSGQVHCLVLERILARGKRPTDRWAWQPETGQVAIRQPFWPFDKPFDKLRASSGPSRLSHDVLNSGREALSEKGRY